MSFFYASTAVNYQLHSVNRHTSRLHISTLLGISMLLFANAAIAADHGNLLDAKAQYEKDRALCLSGQSGQDRTTCLREAGAALSEARRGTLGDEPSSYAKNALIRCQAQPAEDREACQRRVEGAGVTSGSVSGGGILREYREMEIPAAPLQDSSPADRTPNTEQEGISK